jgi:hypothetical protein
VSAARRIAVVGGIAPALRGGAMAMLALVALLLGCASTVEQRGPAERDRAAFDANVWPVLVRDCGFSECHGSTERFFRVVGPGHERLDPAMATTVPVTEAELQFSYDRARSMIDANDPPMSPLLRKPLEVAAGGAGHEGTDNFGRDVYANVNHPSFRVLADWVLSAPLAMPAALIEESGP